MIKNKYQLRQHTKRILVLGFLLGAIIGTIFGAVMMSKNKTCENLKEDYSWLEDSAKDCWSRLRLLDKECWSPSDCSKNPNLEGCHKIEGDCNWCCLNSCTLMACDWENTKW